MICLHLFVVTLLVCVALSSTARKFPILTLSFFSLILITFSSENDEKELVKELQYLNNIKSNQEFSRKMDHILAKKRSFQNEVVDNLWKEVTSAWTPFQDEANKLFGKGEEISKITDTAANLKARKLYKRQMTGLNSKLYAASSRVSRHAHQRRSLAVRKRQMWQRAGRSTDGLDTHISLYSLFESCLLRLGRLPQLLYCEILGCSADDDFAPIPSLPAAPIIGVTPPTATEEPEIDLVEPEPEPAPVFEPEPVREPEEGADDGNEDEPSETTTEYTDDFFWSTENEISNEQGLKRLTDDQDVSSVEN